MTMLSDTHALVHGFVVWDGISRPETLEDGGKKYSVKIAVDPNDAQGIQDLHALEQKQINGGQFKGHLPAGAHRAIGQVGPNEKLADWFQGYYIINAVTYQAPQIVNAADGQDMQPMAWGPKLYTGARIGVIVSSREYNNKQKGVGWWLSGIGIYLDDQSPQLQIGGGGYDARQAFGGGGAQQQQAPQGQQGYGGQPQQQAPQGQPQQQGYGNPQGQQGYQGQPQQQQPFNGSPQPQGQQVPPQQSQPDQNFGNPQQQAPQGQQGYGNQAPQQAPQQQQYGGQPQQQQQAPQGQQNFQQPQGNGYGPQ